MYMERVGDDMYVQRYYSTDFFTLDDVRDYEMDRLWGLGVEVLDYEFKIGVSDGELIFYLLLLFQSLDGEQLSADTLFNHKNLNHE